VIKNLLANYLTQNERKILFYLGAFLIAGMIIRYTGINVIYAEKTKQNNQALTRAVEKDSVIFIDIRTADLEELEFLPGIGPKKAEIIITYRNAKQFESPEELLNIKGIGAKTYLKMKPTLVSFGSFGAGVTDKQKLVDITSNEAVADKDSGQTEKQVLDVTADIPKKEQNGNKSEEMTNESIIHLNSASRAELISLSGIGEKKADAILAYRTEIGKFTSVEQLLDVKGIGTKTLEKNRRRLSL
jgi:competence protein ComEA